MGRKDDEKKEEMKRDEMLNLLFTNLRYPHKSPVAVLYVYIMFLYIPRCHKYYCTHLDLGGTLTAVPGVFTWFSVREMRVRKIRMAMKRLMQRCRWMVVLGLWMERINENVRMQTNRQTNERDRPNQVMSCKSNLSC